MDHQGASATGSNPGRNDSKQPSDAQAKEKKDFYARRKTLVRTLESHSIDIHARPFLRSRIRHSLEREARYLDLLHSTPPFAHGSKLERCAPRIIRRILLALRKAKRMLENGLFWETSAMLALTSKHVGRLRLVGVVDPFADEMDKQARELHKRYAWKGDNDPVFFYGLHSVSVLMGFVDSGCGCRYCRW